MLKFQQKKKQVKSIPENSACEIISKQNTGRLIMQDNCEINYNVAFRNGGGIGAEDVSLFYLNGVTFKGNQANNGSAIHVNDGPASNMQFEDCLFIDNIAQLNGLSVKCEYSLFFCVFCLHLLFFGALQFFPGVTLIRVWVTQKYNKHKKRRCNIFAGSIDKFRKNICYKQQSNKWKRWYYIHRSQSKNNNAKFSD